LLNESVLAPGNRYARSVAGSASSWQRMTLADVAALHEAHVDPQQATVTVVGDLGVLDVAGSAIDAFGRYPSHGVPATPDRPPEPGAGPQLSCRPGRDGAQTQLMLGAFAADRLDPRWPSARVVGELLGGGIDGLLDTMLRKQHALTYGLEVKFLPYYRGGLFTVAGKVDDTGSEQALALILEVLDRVHAGQLDADHFARVRERMVRSAAETYESTLAVAQQYTELDSCGVGADFVDAHLTKLQALDLDRVRADAATLVDPAALHAVAVGRFDPDASVLAHLNRA
jgi:zinc protease